MIVVTGAAGFIGSNLVRRLHERGHAVAIVDKFDDPVIEARASTYLDGLDLKARIEASTATRFLDAHRSDISALIHQGACSDTTVRDRDFVMQNNYEYSKSLWGWCAQAQRPFIYASSASTYGQGELGFSERTNLWRLRPLSLYGQSKQRFDIWALHRESQPPRWAGLKYFNVYGPREMHKLKMASVALHAFRQVLERGTVRLIRSHRTGIPDGEQRRDFMHVDDAVSATLHLLFTPLSEQAPNGLYNIGTGQARSFFDVARAVFGTLGKVPSIEFVPIPRPIRDQYQYYTCADITKLRASGFDAPMLTLEQGVSSYVRWLLSSYPRLDLGDLMLQKSP